MSSRWNVSTDRIPTTPAEWAAIRPSSLDKTIAAAATGQPHRSDASKRALCVAYSRIAEYERCVERLANHPEGGGRILFSSDSTKEARMEWARRILEER